MMQQANGKKRWRGNETLAIFQKILYISTMFKFLCACLSATIQRTVIFDNFFENSVNRSKSYRIDASGKAVNTARVLNQLKKNCVKVICPVGNENADEFISLITKDNIQGIFVKTPGRTRECWTILNKAKCTTTELIADEDSSKNNFRKEQDKILHLIESETENVDAVVLAGSCPASFSSNFYSVIAKIVLDKKKIFLADFSGETLQKTLSVCVPSIIKINDEEFVKTFSIPSYISDEDLKHIIAEKSAFFHNILIVTRGEKSTFAADNGNFVEFPTEKVNAINTTACGDAFSAGFLYEYLSTADFSSSLAKGTWCAARNAETEVPGSIVF